MIPQQIQPGREIWPSFPKTIALVKSRHIKLYLDDVKIVETLAGKVCLVSKVYGQGYYGTFGRDGTFYYNKFCQPYMLKRLQDVEERGFAAVKEIGLLTGSCCVCGRTLVAEGSVEAGIGPVCSGKLGGF